MSQDAKTPQKQEADIVTAAMLAIGDEILSGRTKDKNISYVADHLTMIGIQLREVRIVADEEDDIVAAVNALRARYDYVFTSGGIGPTHDDITADSIAKAFNVPIDEDPRAVALMKAHYDPGKLTPTRLRMARIPEGADLIENIVSIAPGFMLENVIVMAGVPKIMQVMLDEVTPRLKTGKKMLSHTILVHHPEGAVADILRLVDEKYETVSFGSYPFYREQKFGTNLILRSIDEAQLNAAAEELKQTLAEKNLWSAEQAE